MNLFILPLAPPGGEMGRYVLGEGPNMQMRCSPHLFPVSGKGVLGGRCDSGIWEALEA